MKIQELTGKSADELKALLLQYKKEAFNLRFQKSSGQLDNTARIRVVRRTVAKIKMLQNQLEVKAEAKTTKKDKKAA